MPLTPEEEKELAQLESELEPKGDLTPEEEAELAQLEAEFAPSTTGSFLRGAAQEMSIGLADEATAVIESTLGSLGIVNDKTYEQALAESREAYDKAQATNPGAYRAGELAAMTAGIVGAAALAKPVAKLAARTGKPLLESAGSIIKKTADKTKATGETLINKVADKLNMDPENVKDVALAAGEYLSDIPGLSTIGRVLTKGKKVKDVIDTAKKVVKPAEAIKTSTTATKMAEPLVETVAKKVSTEAIKSPKVTKVAEEALVDKIAGSMKGEVKPVTNVIPSKSVNPLKGSAEDLPYVLEKAIIGGKEVMVKKYKPGIPTNITPGSY